MVWTRMGLDQFAGPGVTGPGHRALPGLDHPGKGVPKPLRDVPDDPDGEDEDQENKDREDEDREDVERPDRG